MMNFSHSYGKRVKETIYFNFRVDIGITNFNNIDELIFVTKHKKGREIKFPIYPVKQNLKK